MLSKSFSKTFNTFNVFNSFKFSNGSVGRRELFNCFKYNICCKGITTKTLSTKSRSKSTNKIKSGSKTILNSSKHSRGLVKKKIASPNTELVKVIKNNKVGISNANNNINNNNLIKNESNKTLTNNFVYRHHISFDEKYVSISKLLNKLLNNQINLYFRNNNHATFY